jgi:hypothetical protein
MRGIALGVLLAAGGCGGGFDQSVTVEPAVVRGSVGGLVLDFTTGAPVPDLTVTVIAGDGVHGGITDADGGFVVADVPAGAAVILAVNGGAGFTSAELTVTLPVSAGQVPLAAPETFAGPLGLLPRTLAFPLQLVRDDGTPLEADVFASTAVGWFDLASGAPAPRGTSAASAASANTGVATIGGLADVASLPAGVGSDVITFRVAPVDADGDGAFEFEGVTFARAARDLAAGIEVVNVDSEATSLTIVSSNVQGLLGLGGDAVPSVLDPLEPVRIVFNQPVDPAAVSVTVSDELGVDLAGAAVAAPLPPDDTVVLNPPAAGWPVASEINIDVHATSEENSPALHYDAGAAFFTEDGMGASVGATATVDGADPSLIHVTFSEPIGVTPGAAWSLGGAGCVVFVGRDLNADGDLIGVSEIGGTSSNLVLSSAEPDPVGLASVSGFTKYAYFYLPTALVGSVPFELRFDRVTPATSRPTTASGMLVGNIVMITAL